MDNPSPPNEKAIKPDTWIAFFALLTSIVTIIFSTCESKRSASFSEHQQQRSELHDRLSVRPLLEFRVEYLKSSEWAGVSVKNQGIGPALVIKMDKFYDGNYVKNWGDLTDHLSGLKQAFWKTKDPFRIELKKGKGISSNEEIRLWFVMKDNADLSNAEKVLNKLQLEIQYSDIYNDTIFTAKFP